MKPSRVRALACVAAAPLSVACVAADAGYDDVRRLTSERTGHHVRWYAHESSSAAAKQTSELLSKPLDARSAAAIALLNNQGLQASFEELGTARGRLVQALRLPNPTLNGALRYHADDGDARPEIELEGLLDVSELFFLPLRGGAASSQLDAAKLSVLGRVIDLAASARVAFYEYQAAAQTLELRRSILSALSASFEVARRLHEAGNMTDLSYANERALYEEARLAFTSAEATVQARRETLNGVLGLWGRGAQWKAEARLPEPVTEADTFDGLEARAIERSIDLELIERRFAAAGKGANLAMLRGWIPELRAGVAASREGDEAEWTVGPAIELELPLFYQGQGETSAALSEQRREQRLYADTAVRVRSTARALASRLEAAEKSVSYYRSVLLPLRQQIVDETQLQYNAMNAGVFQLLQAKRDQIEAARAYVELLREYWTLKAQVDQLLSGRLPEGGAALATAPAEAPSERSGDANGH